MESFNDVWNSVKELCKERITSVAYNLWICCIENPEFKDDTVFLYVRSMLQKNVLDAKYMKTLKTAFAEVMGFDVAITVVAEEQNQPKQEPVENADTGFLNGGVQNYTFANFIVGPSNKFAHAASLAVASNPSGAYNPLFIYGGSGLGKTHLLYAICNEINKNNPSSNIIYVKGEEFTNELIAAIQSGGTQDFHLKYREADVLLVDDIQFISGKDSTQEEFFHTFNALYHAGKQIVLTSDRPPKEIKTLEDRLRTRFEWGLLADIQPPDFETRIAIIRRKAAAIDIHIPDEVSEFIANKLKSNIRQLEGAVKKIKAYQLLTNTPPSITIAQTAIRDILSDTQPVPLTVEKILGEVSRTYGISVADIRSEKRTSSISAARQVAMYVVREVTSMSQSDIGKEFNGRDHSTVVYTLKQARKNMEQNRDFREMVEDIIKNIKNT